MPPVEFLDDPPTGDEPADEPEGGVGKPSATRRRSWALAAAVAAVAALVIVINRGGQTAPTAGPVPPLPVASAAPLPPAPMTVEQTLREIHDRARLVAPLHGEQPPGLDTPCKRLPAGVRPQSAASRLLTGTLAGFGQPDEWLVVDQRGWLCEVQVRARRADGTVAVLIVHAPYGPLSHRNNSLRTDGGRVGADEVRYVQYLTGTGWMVLVGASGRHAGAVPAARLSRIAVDPALRW